MKKSSSVELTKAVLSAQLTMEISEILRDKHISLEELADRMGTKKEYLLKYFTGDKSMTILMAAKILSAIKVIPEIKLIYKEDEK